MEQDSETKKSDTMEYKEKIVVGSRIFQAIFMAIFVLGLSMILGDLTGYCELPVSAIPLFGDGDKKGGDVGVCGLCFTSMRVRVR